MDILQKFVNNRDQIVDESIAGFTKCYSGRVEYASSDRALRYIDPTNARRVGIVAIGGWGHDPAFMGYLGRNMLDAVAIGEIFSPPSAEACYAAFRAAYKEKEIICLCGNYPKDIESAGEAAARLEKEGISVRLLIIDDDVGSPDLDNKRGMTGETLIWKIAGAASAKGYSCEQILEICQYAIDHMGTIGVGLASCINPSTGRPNYLIEHGTMEVGVSHHGLFSKDTCKMRTADETADIMMNEILQQLAPAGDSRCAVMISGLGNTMMSELYILYGRVHDRAMGDRLTISHSYVGNFFTSLDMMGATLTVLLLNDELDELLSMPSYPVSLSPFQQISGWGGDAE